MDEKAHDEFRNEVECMWILQQPEPHPSIIRMFHYFEDPKRYCLIQELSTGGDLFDHMQALIKRKEKLEMNEAAIILK